MKKYGLQLRGPPQEKKKPTRPPLPSAPGFGDDDDDDIEGEIARQAAKTKTLRDIEQQHKKALEEDPSVFDYDGVYDQMKEKIARPLAKDRQERKSKYIPALVDKAKQREKEQEIIYERKLAKERSKEDHLYENKEKFVTGAYKRKLAEQAKWLEEERLRDLMEEKEDVTKKKDLSDLYFNLNKNVAFGADPREFKKTPKKDATVAQEFSKTEECRMSDIPTNNIIGESSSNASALSSHTQNDVKKARETPEPSISLLEKAVIEMPLTNATAPHHKKNQDALAAAKERFLARKRSKEG